VLFRSADNARQYEGRTVAEIAQAEGLDPLDLYLKLIDLSGGEGRVYLGQYYNEAILRRLMADDLSLCMTDAWVEAQGVQNAAAYQGYPNFLLNARAWGVPTERVIHKMTGGVAQRFGMKERGMLKEGYFADVTVFDPDALKVKLEQPDFTPEGIRHVLVNGVFAIRDGQYVSQRAGRVLRRR
jgi:N-acyl-D-amino-acid deacylase